MAKPRKLVSLLRHRKVVVDDHQVLLNEIDKDIKKELDKLNFRTLSEIFLLSRPGVSTNAIDKINSPASTYIKRAQSSIDDTICGYPVVMIKSSHGSDKLIFNEEPKTVKGRTVRMISRTEIMRYLINNSGGKFIEK